MLLLNWFIKSLKIQSFYKKNNGCYSSDYNFNVYIITLYIFICSFILYIKIRYQDFFCLF